MKIAVQKYGGSSVASAESREMVAAKIISTAARGFNMVVVLSAMGRYPDPLATDTIIHSIKLQEYERNASEKDLIMSTGENYSCIQMSVLLRKKGFKTSVMSGAAAGIVTDSNNLNAKITYIYASAIKEELTKNNIVLVTGFQGIDPQDSVTTLGRGGSDTTAAAIGAALKADFVEIYTDVDGVMTADPRVYGQACIINSLDPVEMGEMANEGAKVLHTRCVDIANRYNVPLYVKNTFSTHCGSEIMNKSRSGGSLISGLIHKTSIRDFFVDFSDSPAASAKQQSELFKDMKELGVSLDLINIHADKIYFSVAEEDAAKAEAHLQKISAKYKTVAGVAKISCVGIGMRGTAGVMARIFKLLFEEGITVYRSVDSFINISCLINEKNLGKAMKALHKLCRIESYSTKKAIRI